MSNVLLPDSVDAGSAGSVGLGPIQGVYILPLSDHFPSLELPQAHCC